MKKIILSLFVVSLFIFTGTAYAQMGMMGGYEQYGNTALVSVQNSEARGALKEIYQTQGVDSQSKIDCSKVTDDQFDKLGDAYMGGMLSNETQHEFMDNMMGGEGSDSLRQAHVNMGRSYLGCWSNYSSGPVYMPMMNGYGSESNSGSGWGTMSHFGTSGNGFLCLWAISIFYLVWLTVGILAIVWLWRKVSKK